MPSAHSLRAVPLSVELLETREVLSTSAFVNSLYAAFLHRTPAPSEAAGWVSALNAGAYPRQVITSFAASTECATDVVTAAYESLLHRAPDASLPGWVAAQQAQHDSERLDAQLVASPEYFQLHGGTNGSWLQGVYKDVLGRGSDAGAYSWVQALQAGMPRETVAQGIIRSTEGLTRIITAAYQELLRRSPDPQEVSGWLIQMQNGMSSIELRAVYAESGEFIAAQGGIGSVNRSAIDQMATQPTSPDSLPDPQQQRNQDNEAVIAAGPAPLVFLGDSIMDEFSNGGGQPVWNVDFAPLGAVNLGIGGLTTSDVLGQVVYGQVSALAPRVAVLLIGTNNLALGASPAATADGIGAIVSALQARSPQTKVLLLGLLPRGFSPADPYRALVAQVNALLAPLADGRRVTYLDVGPSLLQPGGFVSPAVLADGLHPTLLGYQLIAQGIYPTVLQLLQ